MAPGSAPPRRDFEIGIMCALSVEAHAVKGIFDNFYDDKDDKTYENREDNGTDSGQKAPGDKNAYTIGKIGHHNVVLAYMPNMGKVSAAGVATNFPSSFGGLKVIFLVGICGGMPDGTNPKEIVLGDVIIGKNIIQYDLGRQNPDGFERKDGLEDSLGRQGPEIRMFIGKLESGKGDLEKTTFKYLTALLKNPDYEKHIYPGVHEDKLFQPDYLHKHHNAQNCDCIKGDKTCSDAQSSTCEQLRCDTEQLVRRSRLQDASEQKPVIHFGSIASGDMVMKSGRHRNEIAKAKNIIAFEMEGAGVWDYLPCIIVKGVCDYADSHKNKKWQDYAAVTASACVKAILEKWDRTDKQPQQYHVKNQWNNSGNVKVLNQADQVTYSGGNTITF